MADREVRRMTITISAEVAEVLEATAQFENRKPANVAATVVEQWAVGEDALVYIKPVKPASDTGTGKTARK